MPGLPHRIIITGGPGAGKTTLLEILLGRGYFGFSEAGRAIIQDQVVIGGNALPWFDRQAFAELMLGQELRSWHAAEGLSEPCFYDRGLPDVAGYLNLCQLPIPGHLEKAIATFRYCNRVFIAPPWRGIYLQDCERKQSFAEAELTYRALAMTYHKYGYQLLELPCAPPEERADFIVSQLTRAGF